MLSTPRGLPTLSVHRSNFPMTKSNRTMKHLLLALACLTAASAVLADESLAKARNCMACHSVEKKMVGPALKDVAAKGADADRLAESIKNGSKGRWGAIPMPPNRVSDEEAQKLAVWVLLPK